MNTEWWTIPNTEQFDGHTPGPWMPRDINDGALPHNEADLALMAAAPDLLAEVKRLREEKTFLLEYVRQTDIWLKAVMKHG